MIIDELWMSRALQLAALGLGKVQPNPLVGAVIVHNNRIIGEGFHQQYGAPHAEVNAIHAVLNPELLKQSTLYVNLEPCSHYGKTPPCASLIIEKQIPKVVTGIRDPNEKVNGKGIQMLRDAGIEVVENVLYDECLQLNKRFITFHTKKRPWIILKWAQTKNGFIDVLRDDTNVAPCWITNEALRVWTHKLRNEEQAILVGYNTLINDNPKLTNRLYGTNQPKRFVWCDERKPAVINDAFTYLKSNIKEILDELYAQTIQSVIIEGGKKTLQKFLDADMWDEAFVLVGNVKWEEGTEAPKLLYDFDNKIDIDREMIYHYIKKEEIKFFS
ncbi:MAG: bifunctional diaminohydroxyphosphoribosylaminopyrimidine deaminase/5-amino-6-(5-phosphoribosylamino)uracil reductase RibD [Bacteroidetes bacterium]|nr:bifunctional diaminohydroxyphosphoribosylaminopyrimidine deaminase/5-amino-6-(5-phosphoribosylamino)uracil reductase RibD [Bacteroidota bacterium]MCL1967988.1 bifunctional diaminohydroxyphosphoribosylaminopyrimidine deaminase/5-amino-6-(5-phosphoribosylamino)uracil reductase RibD [Bacteroidota bacterium]